MSQFDLVNLKSFKTLPKAFFQADISKGYIWRKHNKINQYRLPYYHSCTLTKETMINLFIIKFLSDINTVIAKYVLCMPLRRVYLNKVGVIALCKSSPMDFQCPLSEYIYHGEHNIH